MCEIALGYTYMHVRILYHDNCFDGATSAALFTSFYQRCIDPKATFQYLGMSHGPGDVFGADSFVDEASVEHACVDFRYSPDPRLTWWFDHHQSAFISPAERSHFEAAHNPRHFYDPAARSCSKFLSQRCAAVYGFDPAPHAELIHWADLIDGAQFESPTAAVEMREPALQLMAFVEANRDPALKLRFIDELRQRPLADIAAERYVRAQVEPVLAENRRVVEVLRQRARCEGGVVTYDLSDDSFPSPNKFIPYYLYPDCHYVVGVSALPGRVKIGVGSNPWYPARRTANIAAICGRYGGGGHPVVGAVSLAAGQLDRARQVAAEISSELRAAAAQEI